MQDSKKVFLDSNVVIYTYNNGEKEKQQISKHLIAENDTVISTQVLQEVSNVLSRKFKMNFDTIKALLAECVRNNEVYTNKQTTIFRACDIAERYHFSFYDSMIIAAALESGCEVLYSEDLQHNQVIDRILLIENPYTIEK
jgi:predicted nucleic acid-binding protein